MRVMKKEKDPSVRAVVHLQDGALIKGYVDGEHGDALRSGNGMPSADEVQVQLASGDTATIDLSTVKAIFIVSNFDGKADYTEIKFFHDAPPKGCLWVRLRFFDNERAEGMICNSIEFVENEGFFLKPLDPRSNNKMIYVRKKFLKEFSVLGIRQEL